MIYLAFGEVSTELSAREIFARWDLICSPSTEKLWLHES